MLSTDEFNPTREPYYALVTGVSSREVESTTTITYTVDGNTETVTSTDDHEYFVKEIDWLGNVREIGWVDAEDLIPGVQYLVLPDGTLAQVTNKAAGPAMTVYNLTVTDGATYFVADDTGDANAVLVHNARKRTLFILFNKTHQGSLPRPKGLGPNGGRLQSHHGLQREWAVHNLPRYSERLAPTITLETGVGFPHTVITNGQLSRKLQREALGLEKWSSTLQDELSFIVKDLTKAGFSRKVIGQVLAQQYKMLNLLGVTFKKVKF